MNWKAPEIQLALSGAVVEAPVVSLRVRASRLNPVATLDLEISNLHYELSDVPIAKDTPIALSWGYRGDDLTPLFDGFVESVHLRETAKITACCRGVQLRDTKPTLTYLHESVNRIAEHLVRNLDFEDFEIDDDSGMELDKLPIYQDPITKALAWVNRRLELGRDLWCGPSGILHWQAPNRTMDPVATLTDGEDIIELSPLVLGGRKLVTVGMDIWHSVVVEVVDRDGVSTNYFVDEVQHDAGKGTTTTLWLSEVTE